MATLYLTEQGSKVRKEQNRLVIERDGHTLGEVHEFKIDRVVIFGNVQLTTSAIGFLLDRGIDTAFLSLYGKLKGRLAPLETKNALLRLRQYQRVNEPAFATGMARGFIRGKIANCRTVLWRHQRNHPECNLEQGIAQLENLKQRVDTVGSRDSLRGIEGQAASIHFEGLARMLRRGVTFEKRTRRPPTDTVNALLSFGYTLLYNEAISALASAGCDPYLGFFHQPSFGRCSLALDLMEEFRPLIADRLTINLFNLGIISPENFRQAEDGGMRLSDEARGNFLREYERLINAEFTLVPPQQKRSRTTLRKALYEQSLVVSGSLLRKTTYQPF
ncbi:MAG: CRISPR-associated endonuclease Cas1 [Blastocatellia bacterium]|nr:CRISPR-associated endonuclease Cas1 [Blastocatellia bacterium]